MSRGKRGAGGKAAEGLRICPRCVRQPFAAWVSHCNSPAVSPSPVNKVMRGFVARNYTFLMGLR